jgi:hypothetical protein
LSGRYFDAVIRAATRRPWVRRRLADVLQLLRPPSALFRPDVLARVAWDRLAGDFEALSRGGRPEQKVAEAVRRRREGVEASRRWMIEEESRV